MAGRRRASRCQPCSGDADGRAPSTPRRACPARSGSRCSARCCGRAHLLGLRARRAVDRRPTRSHDHCGPPAASWCSNGHRQPSPDASNSPSTTPCCATLPTRRCCSAIAPPCTPSPRPGWNKPQVNESRSFAERSLGHFELAGMSEAAAEQLWFAGEASARSGHHHAATRTLHRAFEMWDDCGGDSAPTSVRGARYIAANRWRPGRRGAAPAARHREPGGWIALGRGALRRGERRGCDPRRP